MGGGTSHFDITINNPLKTVAVLCNLVQLCRSSQKSEEPAEAVLAPLKNGFQSLNEVYQALIKADVDPVTGQCSNYQYIRQQIVQAHEHMQRSEQAASSGLESLDRNLETLIQDEGKLEREMNNTKQTLDNLRTEQASNEDLLRNAQGAVLLARTNLNSAKQTLHDQEKRKHDAEIITGVGAGLLAIPIIGWIVGPAMIIGGAVELDAAIHTVQVAEDVVRSSENELEKYQRKVSDYEFQITETERDISQKDEQLRQTREQIQKVKEKLEAVAEFQKKLRSAVHLLGVLSGMSSVVEHQTRRFIIQEPIMNVMEDALNAMKKVTGNELLYDKEMSTLIEQMKENNRRLTAICASENNTGGNY